MKLLLGEQCFKEHAENLAALSKISDSSSDNLDMSTEVDSSEMK